MTSAAAMYSASQSDPPVRQFVGAATSWLKDAEADIRWGLPNIAIQAPDPFHGLAVSPLTQLHSVAQQSWKHDGPDHALGRCWHALL